MKKRFLCLALVLVMLVGIIPFSAITAFAADGDGLTEATAKVVTNYAEYESAMEDSSIVYVKIDSNIDSAIQKSGSGIDVGAMVAGKKVLIVNATAEFYGYIGAQAIDSLLYVQDGDDLTIKGDGTLRFVPNANATFNSVVRIEGGTVTVSGNVTIEGYTSAANYANAITNNGGNLNLLKGTCKGTLRVDRDYTNNFAVVDLYGGNTVINNIAVSATVSHDGLNESKASAMRIRASVNSAVIQGGTFEKVNTYSIAVDSSKVIADYVYSGIKMYNASTHTEVSDYDEIYTTAQNVYFANAPQNVITSLALGTNKIVSGTKVSDLALTTYDTDKCTPDTYFVMNGLNKGLGDTGNAFLSTDTLNPEYDCSAIYSIYAKDGKTFAPDFSAEDITFTNGVVTNVGNYNNVINVFVNFPKQTSHTHTYDGWTNDSADSHFKVCSDPNCPDYLDSMIEIGAHQFGEVKCTDTVAICTVCQGRFDTVGLYEHNFGQWQEEIPATCSSTGTKAHKDCSVCNKHFNEYEVEIADLTLPIDANNHDMATEWTGVADGHYHSCKRTGCEYHDTLVAHTSSGSATETTPETCTDCGYVITPALGATPGTDTPGTDDPNTGDTDEPKDDEGGLGTGAIAGIVVGSVLVIGVGGFCLYWFVFRKKRV